MGVESRPLADLARRTRARLAAEHAVSDLPTAAWATVASATLAIAAVRLSGHETSSVLLVAAAIVPTAIAVVLRAIARTPSADNALIELDRRLGCQDRLSTAYALEQATVADPFAAIAIRDGSNAAGAIDINAVAPLRASRNALWPALLLACVAVAGVLAPPLNRTNGGRAASPEDPTPLIAALEEASRDLDTDTDTAEDAPNHATDDPSSNATADAIDEIVNQLERGELGVDEAAARSADELEREAESLASRSSATDAAFEGIADAAEDFDAGEDDRLRELSERLAEGDFEAARQAASELFENASTMSDEERARLADDLERLAEQIDERTPPPESVDEDPRTPEDLRRELIEQGVDPTTAEREAEQRAEEQAAKLDDDERRDRSRDLSEALRDEADRVREEASENDAESDKRDASPDERSDDGETESSDSRTPADDQTTSGGSEQAPDETSDQNQGQSQEQNPGQQQGQETGQNDNTQDGGERPESQSDEGDRQSSDAAETPTERPNTEGSQDRPTDSGQAEGSAQDRSEPSQNREQTEDVDQPAGPGEQRNQPSNDDGNSAPNEQSEQGSGEGQTEGQRESQGEAGGEGEEQSERPGDRSRSERLDETLRRMAEQRRQALQDGERSERLREAAEQARRGGRPRDNKTGTSPTDQPRGSSDRAPPSSHEFDEDLVDARRGDDPASDAREGTRGNWRPDDRPGQPGASRGGDAPMPTVRDATERASRAVEQRRVPSRYADFIKRVFDRYGERDATTPPSETTPLGADAPAAPPSGD